MTDDLENVFWHSGVLDWYITNGFALYPVKPAKGEQKAAPYIKGWNSGRAATDLESVRRFWSDFPDAQIGADAERSNIIVVDIDPRNGGDDSFRTLANDVGIHLFDGAPTVNTPSRGRHLYYRATKPIRGRTSALGPGIDVIGRGNGIMLPPSFRADANAIYHWRLPNSGVPTLDTAWPETFEPPDFPDELVWRMGVGKAANHAKARLVERGKITQGRRNVEMFGYARAMRQRLGLREAGLLAVVDAINREACEPPLPEKEIRMICDSVDGIEADDIDPVLWLHAWMPRGLSGAEFRLASAYAKLAEYVIGDFTPSEATVTSVLGEGAMANYFRDRAGLVENGAILVRSRGRKQSPIIEFIMPTP